VVHKVAISIFVAGDFHIPSRAAMIPPDFQEILESKRWDFIVLTGDYTSPTVLEYFQRFVKKEKNLIACRGNMDQFWLADQITFFVDTLACGVDHGTTVSPRGDIAQLKALAIKMNVRVLFTGHTHRQEVYFDNEHLILNPGTSTGASGGSSWTVDTGILTLEVLPQKTFNITQYTLLDPRKLIKLTFHYHF